MHPFWLDGKGWTFVKDLKVGDLLVSSDSTKLAIDKIEKEPREATVYNFEVKDFNSYFVSNLGVWVHNCALQNVYKSIKDSPLYPQGFSGAKNGTVKNKVNNGELLEELRAIESGTGNKIYKDGVDANGKKSLSITSKVNLDRCSMLRRKMDGVTHLVKCLDKGVIY